MKCLDPKFYGCCRRFKDVAVTWFLLRDFPSQTVSLFSNLYHFYPSFFFFCFSYHSTYQISFFLLCARAQAKSLVSTKSFSSSVFLCRKGLSLSSCKLHPWLQLVFDFFPQSTVMFTQGSTELFRLKFLALATFTSFVSAVNGNCSFEDLEHHFKKDHC